ncbi:hypothetical protein [Streptomyces sp. NPDC058254]|uniref:hypothetical protein n=1 Tax=Streptomyces sp. NPDC058254 TaxID=3346406 RepID=UPI0036EFEFF5
MFTSLLKYDALERAAWTGVQGALGVLVVEYADVSLWGAVPVAAVLALAKSWVAGRLGRKGTASTLPAAKDPATPPAI